jgi:peptidoglycan hydrolase-like protein with peptidoglycan-binding domain
VGPPAPEPTTPAQPAPAPAEPKPEPKPTPALDAIAKNRDVVARKNSNAPDPAVQEIQENLVKSGVAVKVSPEDYKNLAKGDDGIVRDANGKVALNEADLGHYGKQTEAAVNDFQENTGILKPDGKVGRATAVALKESAKEADVNGKPLVDDKGEVNPKTQGKVKGAVVSELMGDDKITKLEEKSISVTAEQVKQMATPNAADKTTEKGGRE